LVYRFAFAIYPNIGQLRTSKTTKHLVHSINYIILKFIMAPSAVEVNPTTRIYDLKAKALDVVSKRTAPAKLIKTPIQLTGALDKFESFDLTPCIGKEFPGANLAEWLQAPNADELIRDLAVTGWFLYSLLSISVSCFISD
jgi:hypothetical protein